MLSIVLAIVIGVGVIAIGVAGLFAVSEGDNSTAKKVPMIMVLATILMLVFGVLIILAINLLSGIE